MRGGFDRDRDHERRRLERREKDMERDRQRQLKDDMEMDSDCEEPLYRRRPYAGSARAKDRRKRREAELAEVRHGHFLSVYTCIDKPKAIRMGR